MVFLYKTCPKGFGLKVAKLRLKTLLKMKEAIGVNRGQIGSIGVNQGAIGNNRGQSRAIGNNRGQAGANCWSF